MLNDIYLGVFIRMWGQPEGDTSPSGCNRLGVEGFTCNLKEYSHLGEYSREELRNWVGQPNIHHLFPHESEGRLIRTSLGDAINRFLALTIVL